VLDALISCRRIIFDDNNKMKQYFHDDAIARDKGAMSQGLQTQTLSQDLFISKHAW
jgi:hypothetical protein